jgi:alcohol dehydrogenase class IV
VSPISFEFATAGRILFGGGRFEQAGRVAREFGTRALVVTGRSADRFDRLAPLLEAEGVTATRFIVAGEPTVEDVRAGASTARREGCTLVVAVGGGSAIDAGKAVAALAANDGDVLDYLEVIGRGRPVSGPPMPCVAIPTTGGTGSEVTRNAVLASPQHHVKVSLRHPGLLPRVAIVDPDLSMSVPAAVTAATGLDALTQLIEAYVTRGANPVTDALCLEGISRAARALPAAVRNGANRMAREAMALAALFSGIALANAGLGAVHGLAGPLGGTIGAPHGALCAVLVPHVVRVNLGALAARQPGHPARARFDAIARLLTGRESADGAAAVEWLRHLVADAGLPPLRAYGLAARHVPEVVERARRASSMKGNPIELTTEELTTILEEAM